MREHDQARLLLAILRERWDEAKALARPGPVAAAPFVDLCERCDVPTWVHARLVDEARGDLLGPDIMDRLGRLRAGVRRDNLLLIARAEQALGILLDAGATPVALKGLDLLYRGYEGFDERKLDDVDLLVRRDDLRVSLAALEAEGWTTYPEPKRTHFIRSSHHLPMRSPGPITVDFEIHWNLAQEMRYRIDVAGLFERAVPLDVGGRQVLRLDDHDAMAHLLLHHFTHYFDRRLKWAIDLEMLGRDPGFDWTVVIERLRAWGATAVTGASLLHLQKLFPERIPAEALAGLPVAAWRRALLWPLRSPHPLDLVRGARRRWVQLYVAAVLLEKPALLPRWLVHRATRDSREGDNPLDDAGRRG
jgi:hypothetical protein